MPFIYATHQGLAYGDGHMQSDGELGQVVRLVGDDLFAVNTDTDQPSFGILRKSYKAGEMPGVFCNGGVYETDVFDGTPSAGDYLMVSANGKLVNGVDGRQQVIAQAISVNGGTLKFRLMV